MKEKESAKRIKILTESGPIEVVDFDNTNLEDYSKKISALLESSNVSILETTSGFLVIRPSKIYGISILEEKVAKEVKKSSPKLEEDILMEE